jgi:ubiquinone/menaquinone biosynthesis C-methylase UbiE
MTMKRPHFIAHQARDARGPLGRIIAFIMAYETRAQNRQAMAALEIRNGDNVVDVGCGPGGSLSALSEMTPEGLVVGVDPSQLMAEIAANRIRRLIGAGRADVAVAPVEKLPFVDESFDKALCVHVLYFWPELQPALAEIARVLKPGGRLALLFRTSDSPATASFPAEVYRFRTLSEVAAALADARLDVREKADVGDCVLITAERRPCARSQDR